MKTSPALLLGGPRPPAFDVRLDYADRDSVRVVVRGDVDLATQDHVAEAIERAWFTWPAVVVVDLTAVTFLSASGAGVLAGARAAAAAQGVTLVVDCCPGVVRWVVQFVDQSDALRASGTWPLR